MPKHKTQRKIIKSEVVMPRFTKAPHQKRQPIQYDSATLESIKQMKAQQKRGIETPIKETLNTKEILNDPILFSDNFGLSDPAQINDENPSGDNDGSLESIDVRTSAKNMLNRPLIDYSDEILSQQQFFQIMGEQKGRPIGGRGGFKPVADLDTAKNAVSFGQISEANYMSELNEFSTSLEQLGSALQSFSPEFLREVRGQ